MDEHHLHDAGKPSATGRRRWRTAGRWLLRSLAVLLALGLLMALAVWLLDARQAVAGAGDGIRRAKPLLVAIHLALIGALWWYWTPIVQWLKARGRVTEHSLPVAMALRHRFVGFLLAFEWLVVIRWPLGQW
jgi:hypothetical protein